MWKHEVLSTFWLGNVLRAKMARNCSSLIWPDGSAPVALASLLFDPLEPQTNGKSQWFATFVRFRAPTSYFFSLFLSSLFFSSSFWLFPPLFFHFSILLEVWLLDFLRSVHTCPYPCMPKNFQWTKICAWYLTQVACHLPAAPLVCTLALFGFCYGLLSVEGGAWLMSVISDYCKELHVLSSLFVEHAEDVKL